MNQLISAAAVLQIGEARIMAYDLAKVLGAEEAESGHPVNGFRPSPDEMTEAIEAIFEFFTIAKICATLYDLSHDCRSYQIN